MELLVATALTVSVLTAVTVMVGILGRTVNESRATLEMTDRLRAVTARLQNDLEGVTVSVTAPIDPGIEEGYLKYIEGRNPLFAQDPKDPGTPPPGVWPHAGNTDQPGAAGTPLPDTTVIDHNDILMFTTRSKDKPFMGRAFVRLPNGDIRRQAESQVAEVAWFVRGRTLYRRVLLVLPDFDADLATAAPQPALSHNDLASIAGYPAGTRFSFYQFYDLSVRRHDNGTPDDLSDDYLILNSLGDLTKPENRFAHQSARMESKVTKWDMPFHPHVCVIRRPGVLSTRLTAWHWLGLPTLKETTHPGWGVQGGTAYPSNAGAPLPMFDLTIGGNSIMTGSGTTAAWMSNPYDLQVNPHPFEQQDPQSGSLISPIDTLNDPAGLNPPRTRAEEDVVLENVVGFDVKAWDPEAPVLQYPKNPGPGGGNTVLQPGDRGYPASNDPEWARIINGTSSTYGVAARGAYVDLNYGPNAELSHFSGGSTPKLPLGSLNPGGTYDTWSTHYESDGIDNNNDGLIDPATDGFDTAVGGSTNGLVDDVSEQEAPPPYARPLRGLKVTVRVYEPFSRNIREVTITQDFSRK